MNAWSRLTDRLSTTEPATALAVVRILVGLVLLWDLVDIGLSGALGALWMPRSAGGMYVVTANGPLADLIGTSVATIGPVYGATVTAAVLVVAGLGSRPAALVALLGANYLFSLSSVSGGGHDRVFSNTLFLLCFARADMTLSLRCWLTHRRWHDDTPVPAWPRYLLVYQLALIYTMTGVQKLGSVWWPMGGFLAVHYTVMLPHWARADWWWLAWLSPVTRAATALTWWWEALWFLVPAWLWLRATPEVGGRLRALAARFDLRTPFVVTGILMHGTIWLLLNLGPFSAVTLGLYPALYHPDELHRAWKRLRG